MRELFETLTSRRRDEAVGQPVPGENIALAICPVLSRVPKETSLSAADLAALTAYVASRIRNLAFQAKNEEGRSLRDQVLDTATDVLTLAYQKQDANGGPGP